MRESISLYRWIAGVALALAAGVAVGAWSSRREAPATPPAAPQVPAAPPTARTPASQPPGAGAVEPRLPASATRSPWSDRTIGPDAQRLVKDLWLSEDNVRFLVDDQGRVPDARRDALLGAAAQADELARRLGLDEDKRQQLRGIFTLALVREKISLARTPNTDDAAARVRDDAVLSVELTLGEAAARAAAPIIAKLPHLPDR